MVVLMDYIKSIVSLRFCNHRNIFLLELFYKKNKSLKIIFHFTKWGVCSIYIFEKVNYNNKERIRIKNKHMSQYNFQYHIWFFFAYLDINMFSFMGHTFNMALAFERDKIKSILIQNLFRSLSKLRVIALLRVMHLLTNGFEQSSIWQSEVIETNYTSVKQFRFIVTSFTAFVQLLFKQWWSLSQWSIHCFKCSMSVPNK